MKKLCFLMFLLFHFLSPKLNAQDCTNYPYVLGFDGFVCESEGEVCFTTFPLSWMENNACDEFSISIFFQANDFTVTDFGDWVDFPFFPNITRLRYDPPNQSTFQVTGCFTGELINPNASFSLLISNVTTGEIIEATSFQLGQSVTIGTPGTVTQLTDWITPSGPLLSAIDALTNAQSVVVQGTVEINTSYTFGNSPASPVESKLWMDDGARFEVLSGNELGVNYGSIRGCGGTWDRINVQNGGIIDLFNVRVSDADVAIELQDGSIFFGARIDFENNDIGIGSFGPQAKDFDFNLFWNTSGFLTRFIDCREGMHMENVDNLVINGGLIFLNNHTGIWLDNTDLASAQNVFFDCDFGVFATTPNDLMLLDQTSFQGGGTGVYTNGTGHFEVINSQYTDLRTGVHRRSATPKEFTLIENNGMFDCRENVTIRALAGEGLIQHNQLDAARYNVQMFGLDAAGHDWEIQHNERLTVDGPTGPLFKTRPTNISLNYINGATVHHNQDWFTSTKYNIRLRGGMGNHITRNSALADDESLQIWGSPHFYAHCNNLSAPRAIRVYNNSNGSDVWSNDLRDDDYYSISDFNLNYGSPTSAFADVGIQDKTGNFFDNSSESSPVAINHSTELVAEQNQYIVAQNPQDQGSNIFPFFVSDFDEWFDPQPGNNLICLSLPPGTKEEEALKKSVWNNRGLLGMDIGGIYGAEVEFDTELKLCRQLHRLHEMDALEPDLQSLYENYANSKFARFIQLEKMYSDAVSFTENEAQVWSTVNADISSLFADLTAITWYTIDNEGEVEIDAAAKGSYDLLLDKLAQKKAELAALRLDKQQALGAALGDMMGVYGEIGEFSTTSGQNLKEVHGYLLQRLAPDFAGFSAIQLTAIQAIAEQCAGHGGEAVYMARSLYADAGEDVDELDIDDECIPASDGGELPELITTTSDAYVLHPNPTSDIVELRLPREHEVNGVSVMDMQGHILQNHALESGQTALSLKVGDLPPGVYYIAGENAEFPPLRFVVSR